MGKSIRERLLPRPVRAPSPHNKIMKRTIHVFMVFVLLISPPPGQARNFASVAGY